MRGPADGQAPNAPQGSLETLLWRTVSQHADLAECLPKVIELIAEEAPLLGVLVRRLAESPPRLVTAGLASVPRSGLPLDRLASARTGLSGQGASELRRVLACGAPVSLSEAPQDLAEVLFPFDLPVEVWAAPLLASAGHAGVALFLAESGVSPSAVTPQFKLSWPCLGVAFKNDLHFHEVNRLREALKADREALLSRLGRQDICEVVVGENSGLSQVMAAVFQVARTDAPVLILGETGSGKEVIARAIHERSARSRGPVVR